MSLNISPQNFRIIITLILFSILKYYKSPFIYIVLALFFVDSLDCTIYNLFKSYDCSSKNLDYQVKDKILDLFTYFIFLLLFYNYFDRKTIVLLIILLVWRSIGVLKFFKTQHKKFIRIFFDGLNGIILLFLLTTYYPYFKLNYNLWIMFALIIKVIFEQIHHRNN